MADLESVLQDVSYLMAMEKSKSGSKLAVTKKVALPDASVHCVVDMHLAKLKQRSFKTVYNQQLGEWRMAHWGGKLGSSASKASNNQVLLPWRLDSHTMQQTMCVCVCVCGVHIDCCFE